MVTEDKDGKTHAYQTTNCKGLQTDLAVKKKNIYSDVAHSTVVTLISA
jgi:hypothetical protein